MWISPFWPPSRLTKAPKCVMPVTLPSTVCPTRLGEAALAPLAGDPLGEDPLLPSGWVSGGTRPSVGCASATGGRAVSVSPVPEISDPPPQRFPKSLSLHAHLRPC